MESYFEKVKKFLLNLNYDLTYEDEIDEVFVIQSEEDGIKNLVIGCADPILIIEQFLIEIVNPSSKIYEKLLQKNREIVHGAFVIDESGKKLIFRDTLQLENLDENELEGSINSLRVLLSEYFNQLIELGKK